MNDDEVWADERFTSFRREVEAMARDGKLASNQIGHDLIFNTADGPSSYIYADWGASGRALQLVEDFLRDTVLPYYANPHTRASLFGRRTNALRAAARTIVASYCGAEFSKTARSSSPQAERPAVLENSASCWAYAGKPKPRAP